MMRIIESDAEVVKDNISDAIKFLDVHFPDAYAHMKGLYTSLYLMQGNTYVEAITKAENMLGGK